MAIKQGILNQYVKKPKNLTEYTAYRGVTDFTQIGQFAQFETGYSFLSVISMPKFMTALAKVDPTYMGPIVESFKHMLEYEFKGLDGLPDMSTENNTITNGIQDLNMINKVTQDSSITISMTFNEKTGSPVTKFIQSYLTGIKDKSSQAKGYHGLIESGEMDGGPENEIFTLLYMVTDNTYLENEKAYLFTNCQITKCDNIYNSQRGDISNKEITIEMQCFPIDGFEVDKAAKAILQTITGVQYTQTAAGTKRSVVSTDNVAVLDSNSYNYKAISEIK